MNNLLGIFSISVGTVFDHANLFLTSLSDTIFLNCYTFAKKYRYE
jgi:hypothetical protein